MIGAYVRILSAGWGLISADFLTPSYDITFSPSADAYKRRRMTDRYDDFRMLPNDTENDIEFFNSASVPRIKGCTLRRFETTTRTNWHYECANAFLDGMIRP